MDVGPIRLSTIGPNAPARPRADECGFCEWSGLAVLLDSHAGVRRDRVRGVLASQDVQRVRGDMPHDERSEVLDAFTRYTQAFQALDARAVAQHFHQPALFITPNAIVALPTVEA